MPHGNAAPALNSVEVRRAIINESNRAHVGHIGSALSITDILVALYSRVMDANEDYFILSIGARSTGLVLPI